MQDFVVLIEYLEGKNLNEVNSKLKGKLLLSGWLLQRFFWNRDFVINKLEPTLVNKNANCFTSSNARIQRWVAVCNVFLKQWTPNLQIGQESKKRLEPIWSNGD